MTAKGMFMMKDQKGSKIEVGEEEIRSAISTIKMNVNLNSYLSIY